MFKDFFGVPLAIGDTVAFNAPVYKGLSKGKVVAFTPQSVRVSYNASGKQGSGEQTTVVSPYNCVKENK